MTRSKTLSPISLQLTLICSLFLFLLFIILKSTSSPSLQSLFLITSTAPPPPLQSPPVLIARQITSPIKLAQISYSFSPPLSQQPEEESHSPAISISSFIYICKLFLHFHLIQYCSQVKTKKSMTRSKTLSPISLQLTLICSAFLFLLFIILKSTSSPSLQSLSLITSTTPTITTTAAAATCTPTQPITPTCTKIPESLSQALTHYATSKITPQQTLNEISISLNILSKKSPCNFLVFGLGHDSLMWTSLNHGGNTVFLEEDASWIEQMSKKFPQLKSHHVVYDTKLTEADELIEIGRKKECREVTDPRDSKCRLAIRGFPSEVYEVEWDLIMVDAPTGYFDGAPGRMTAIYTAGMMARNREEGETEVFVHDVNRKVEDKFSKEYLCEGYLRKEEGRLRHFTIPSHRARLGRPFCP